MSERTYEYDCYLFGRRGSGLAFRTWTKISASYRVEAAEKAMNTMMTKEGYDTLSVIVYPSHVGSRYHVQHSRYLVEQEGTAIVPAGIDESYSK